MSSYITGNKPLEFDNAPDWLVNYMQYRLVVLGGSRNSTMTYFLALREYTQWASMYKADGRQPKTQEALREIDILATPLSCILDLSRNDIEAYLFFLANTLSNGPQTRNKKLAAIQSLYDYLIDQQAALGITLESNPAERIKRPKPPKKQPVYLPEEDQHALLMGIKGDDAPRDYAIILLMLSTGMRISEVVALDMQHINFTAKTLRITGAKGNKDRVAYLTDPCIYALKKYIEEYRSLITGLDTDALFVSTRRKARLTNRAVQKIMERRSFDAKLEGKGYSPHKLRHTTATMLAKDGQDLQIIQRVLGHEKPETTEIYTHLDHSDIAKAVDGSRLAKLE